ncbi:hypothetical protein NFI96_008129 [Prochilodus magdalenae]|nr:hypothetical protein NFI96_008129 [Prochilodus magdalenae]
MELRLWSSAVELCCGALLWSSAVELCCGALLWSSAVELCCGALLSLSNAFRQQLALITFIDFGGCAFFHVEPVPVASAEFKEAYRGDSPFDCGPPADDPHPRRSSSTAIM